MRIKMAGAYTTYEFLDAMDCIVQSLEANGLQEIRGANLYLQPFRYGRLLEFEDQETGAPFTLIKFEGREKRKFKIRSPRIRPMISQVEDNQDEKG